MTQHEHTTNEQKSTLTIGVIGLGNVGNHYAMNLYNSDWSVSVFDADPVRLEAFKNLDVDICDSIHAMTITCNVFVLALPNPDIVQNVLLGDDGMLEKLQPDSLIIDISTIDPDTAGYLYQQAKVNQVYYLEAPMSGGEPGGAGVDGAASATITFMCGGDEAAFDNALPILKTIGMHAFLLGPVGTGNTVKLISNLIAGLNMAVIAEGFMLGAALGIHHDKLLEVFKHTDAKSFTMFEEFAPHLRENNYEDGFPVDLMHKDHRLAAELGRKHEVPLLFNQLALETYQIAQAQGHGRDSHAIIVEVLAKLASVNLFNKSNPGTKN